MRHGGKCDSLSFSGNDRFAKCGPGERTPCAAQLGSMHHRLLPSLSFPSTFKISIATFLLTAKTWRHFLVSSVALMSSECAGLERGIAWREELATCQTACWRCFIETTLVPCYMHCLCKKPWEGESLLLGPIRGCYS